jgi:hypothetical protein
VACQAVVPDFTSLVTATDNCTAESLLIISQLPAAGTLVSTGITNIIITVTDEAGNQISCFSSFTVTDHSNPVVITCAPNQFAFTNSSCHAVVPDFTSSVVVTDNCTNVSSLVITQSPLAGTVVQETLPIAAAILLLLINQLPLL